MYVRLRRIKVLDRLEKALTVALGNARLKRLRFADTSECRAVGSGAMMIVATLPPLLSQSHFDVCEVLMRKYFFVGPNKRLKSGMSIKVWKIERRNRRVQVWWGRARLDVSRRRVRSKGKLTTKWWDFPNYSAAEDQMWTRIRSKVRGGYKRNPRRWNGSVAPAH